MEKTVKMLKMVKTENDLNFFLYFICMGENGKNGKKNLAFRFNNFYCIMEMNSFFLNKKYKDGNIKKKNNFFKLLNQLKKNFGY